MSDTKIEWTDTTWNPVTGCNKVSPGCKNCYAERMANRLQAMGNHRYANGFAVTLHHDLLYLPAKWKQPRRVFVNSMSDLFHDAVPVSFIQSIFATIAMTPQHTYQVLTKRPQRALQVADDLVWPANLWMGVSVETPVYYERIEQLSNIPAQTRFLSLEPLLAALPDLPLHNIDWVIVGGESGPRSRIVKADWIREIRDQCVASNVAFFFKQWGGVRKKQSGRELDGRIWDEMPRSIA